MSDDQNILGYAKPAENPGWMERFFVLGMAVCVGTMLIGLFIFCYGVSLAAGYGFVQANRGNLPTRDLLWMYISAAVICVTGLVVTIAAFRWLRDAAGARRRRARHRGAGIATSMWRRIGAALVLTTMLLSLAAGFFWIRSYHVHDHIQLPGSSRYSQIDVGRGRFYLSSQQIFTAAAYGHRTCHPDDPLAKGWLGAKGQGQYWWERQGFMLRSTGIWFDFRIPIWAICALLLLPSICWLGWRARGSRTS